jgi:hypothetical protein
MRDMARTTIQTKKEDVVFCIDFPNLLSIVFIEYCLIVVQIYETWWSYETHHEKHHFRKVLQFFL